MSDTMAKDPARARELMMQVWPAAVARVKEEVADMQAIAAADGHAITIEPWDYLYYADRVRKAKYDLQQSEVKPYFELGNIVAGALWAAEQRYEIAFREITGRVPVFHPDVRVWEVTDTPSGAHRGLFYLDNFARTGKRSGAWAAAYRTQSTFDGPVTAITSNNNNFVKGAPGEPVLISLDDAETLFHEFGMPCTSCCRTCVPRPRRDTPRFRRVSLAGERALAADARSAGSLRAALSDEGTHAAGPRRQDRAQRDLQPGLHDG